MERGRQRRESRIVRIERSSEPNLVWYVEPGRKYTILPAVGLVAAIIPESHSVDIITRKSTRPVHLLLPNGTTLTLGGTHGDL